MRNVYEELVSFSVGQVVPHLSQCWRIF